MMMFIIIIDIIISVIITIIIRPSMPSMRPSGSATRRRRTTTIMVMIISNSKNSNNSNSYYSNVINGNDSTSSNINDDGYHHDTTNDDNDSSDNEADWRRSMELLRTPLAPCVRTARPPAGSDWPEALGGALAALLREWDPEPVPWVPGAYRLRAPSAVDAEGKYHTRLAQVLCDAQRAGHLTRQETASMLPVVALRVQQHHRVLELCAAPGSKTLQLLDALHGGAGGPEPPTGLLVAGDLKPGRLKKLIDRCRRVPASPLLVTREDARRFPGFSSARGRLQVRF